MGKRTPRPTRAAAGSAAKTAVLARRARGGLPLHVDGDELGPWPRQRSWLDLLVRRAKQFSACLDELCELEAATQEQRPVRVTRPQLAKLVGRHPSYVSRMRLPPPRLIGGKLCWNWALVRERVIEDFFRLHTFDLSTTGLARR